MNTLPNQNLTLQNYQTENYYSRESRKSRSSLYSLTVVNDEEQYASLICVTGDFQGAELVKFMTRPLLDDGKTAWYPL